MRRELVKTRKSEEISEEEDMVELILSLEEQITRGKLMDCFQTNFCKLFPKNRGSHLLYCRSPELSRTGAN